MEQSTMTAKKETKEAKKAESLLGGVDGGKSAAKKGEMPVFKGLEEAVDSLVRAKFIADKAKAIHADAESVVIDGSRAEYERLGTSGSFTKSLRVTGSEFDHVTVTWKDSFGTIPLEMRPNLVATVAEAEELTTEEAEKEVASWFEEKRDVRLANTSDAAIALLGRLCEVAAIIADDSSDPVAVLDAEFVSRLRRELRGFVRSGASTRFDQLFDVSRSLVASKGMDERQFSLPQAVRDLLKQGKASTTVKVEVATKAAAEDAVRRFGGKITSQME
jgi:hypothetical protein